LRILRHTQRLQGPACIERIAAFEQIGHRQRATQHRRPVLLRCGQVDQRAVFIGGPLRARLLLGLFGDLLDLAQSGGIARAFTGCLSPSSVRASSLLRGISATSVSTSLRACLTVATSCSTSAFCAATASSAACVAEQPDQQREQYREPVLLGMEQLDFQVRLVAGALLVAKRGDWYRGWGGGGRGGFGRRGSGCGHGQW
jgi:hypothetical protein